MKNSKRCLARFLSTLGFLAMYRVRARVGVRVGLVDYGHGARKVGAWLAVGALWLVEARVGRRDPVGHTGRAQYPEECAGHELCSNGVVVIFSCSTSQVQHVTYR